MVLMTKQNHDTYGPIWPFSIDSLQVQISALNLNREGVGELAEGIYRELFDTGIEILF